MEALDQKLHKDYKHQTSSFGGNVTQRKHVQTGQKQVQVIRDYAQFVFRRVHADSKTDRLPQEHALVEADVTFLMKELHIN